MIRRSALSFLCMAALVAAVLVAVAPSGARASSAVACETPQARNLVLISTRTAKVDRSFPDSDRGPNVVLADGRGGWFVGGSFGCIGSVAVPGLVRLGSDGTLDRSWTAGLPADTQFANGYPTVFTLARAGGVLYAGGGFGVLALSAATGARLWLAPVKGKTGVISLAANTNAVFLAGDFHSVAGSPRSSLAALDPRNGRVLSWRPAHICCGPSVDAVALVGTRLYIGGNGLSSVGGRTRPGLAALNARDGSVTRWQPNPVGDVETIVVAHGQAMTAGHDGFGVTDIGTGNLVSWMHGVGGIAYRFAASGDTAYLGGNCRNTFSAVDGKPRNNLASVNLATGHFTNWAPKVNKYTCVNSIAATANQVLVAGDFAETLG
jgi:trimeric autotransporter adhesin